MTQETKACEQQRRAAIRAIREAFNGIPRGTVTLHQALVLDSHGSEAKQAEARLRDKEAKWQDVSEQDIERGEAALSFLDPQSFRYYIPAYMIWTLEHFRTIDSGTVDATIYSLNRSIYSTPATLPYFDERAAAFTAKERRAISLFLQYCATCTNNYLDEASAAEALEYWAKEQDRNNETHA